MGAGLRASAGLLAVAAASVAAPAAGQTGPVYARAVERTVERFIVPGYAALSAAGEGLVGSMKELCADPGEGTLSAARARFARVLAAFSRMESLRFGPARENHRFERLFFWPDRRGRGRRQVEALLAREDPKSLDVPALREKSVAVQGLLALARATPPVRLRKLSIRHIAEGERGTIWFGGQYEGPRTDSVALVGCHRRGEELDVLPAPRTVVEAMRGYVGAVAASRDGAEVAVTSPRGSLIAIWNARSRKVVKTRRIADVCGVASGGSGFLASDGMGRIWRDGEVVSRRDGVQWDNHLAVAGPAGRVGPAG